MRGCGLKDDQIRKSLRIARKNWKDWKDVFEHSGSIGNNPLLADQQRFAHFLWEYRVTRTVRSGTHEKLRLRLAKSETAFRDDTGQALDKLEQKIRQDFGTHDGKNRLTSILSKVAACVRPERFVACDSYAKKGLNVVLGRAASCKFNAYSDYLAMFDKAWNDQSGQKIRGYMRKCEKEQRLESQPRFQRRILDVCLMMLGDCWE
jgi:hypothetical protein